MRYRDALSLPRGLEPIPIAPASKRPAMRGWRAAILSPATIEKLADRFAHCGIATRLGQKLPRPGNASPRVVALDVDTEDDALASEMRALFDERLGAAPVRWGRRPGFARLLLLDSEARPKKRVSRVYADFLGRKSRVELLTHKLMLYGEHPSSGADYEWSDPLLSLDGLAVHPPEIVDELFARFDAIAEGLGLELLEEASSARAEMSDDDFLAGYAPTVNATRDELAAALEYFDPSCGYHEWIQVGMALHHQFEGGEEGLDLWDEWSSDGASYEGRESLIPHWVSFSRHPPVRPITARTILRRAREARRQDALEDEADDRLQPDELVLELERRVLPDGNEGPPLPTLLNVVAIVRRDATLSPYWLNELNDSPYVGERRVEDTDPVRLRYHLASVYRFEPPTAMCREAIEMVATENPRNPVRDYLGSLEWDGEPRLDRWLSTYLGADDEPHLREAGRKTLLAAVLRVFEPGTKWDYMLILEGLQGCGKSTAVHALSPSKSWTVDLEVSKDEKRMQEIIASAWLVEFGELRGMRNADVRLIKAFLSRTHDTYRRSYGRFTVEQPRRCIFIGTTNDTTGYLQDETGNRRFVPVPVRNLDLVALTRDRDQLWAEAVRAYHDEEPLAWSDETLARLTAEQEERVEIDDWEESVAIHLATLDPETDALSPKDIALEALGLTTDKFGLAEQRRLSRIMKRLGWKRQTVRLPGRGPTQGYRRLRPDEL